MHIPNGIFKARKEKPSGYYWIYIEFSVDDLMTNNTPHVNFWGFCVLHNLLIFDEETQGYLPKISYVDLRESEDEKKNEIVIAMLKKYEIDFSTKIIDFD